MTPIYALYVHHARKAAQELAEAGFEAWAPTYKRLRPQRRQRPAYLEDEALFPGYVFARIPGHRFAAARGCERVIGVVSSNRVPVPIPESLYADVVALVASGRFDERLPGTKARPRKVRRTGLAGLSAWFEMAAEDHKEAA